MNLHIELLVNPSETPLELLYLSDPSKAHINSNLQSGSCYIAKLKSEIVGVIVLGNINSTTTEIKNIAVKESEQGKGIGKFLLRYAEDIIRESGNKKLIIGTGNSSIGQLALYQKEGFEIESIKKDFFLRNYDEIIFENGIHCKHMVVLGKKL